MSDHKTKIQEAITSMVQAMNLECSVEVTEEIQEQKTVLAVSLHTPEHAKFLIGKNGQNLQALEHILRAMFLKQGNPYATIILDVNDYKKSRAVHALEVARQAVTRVRNTQKAEALIPMSSYERRMVHMELASTPDVVTESIGEEPQRRIVIKPL